MRRIWWAVFAVFTFMLVIVIACMAGSNLKVIIDGKTAPGLQPRLEKGAIIIDAQDLAHAMQASTIWDKKASTLQINRIIPPDEIRVSQLENALAATSPEAAARSWAQAVKTRNGAWQYALLSPELQAKSDYAANNWVTGCSSPWVEEYRVTPYHPEQSKAIQYQVDYIYATSTGWAGQGSELLTIANQVALGNRPTWLVTAREDGPLIAPVKGFTYDNHELLGGFNLITGLPLGWKLKATSGQLTLLDQRGQIQGNMELIGGNYLPNHSQTLQQEDIFGVYGQGRVMLISLTQPAASFKSSSQQAVYALVPLKNNSWLQLSLPTNPGSAKAAFQLARNIAQTTIVFTKD